MYSIKNLALFFLITLIQHQVAFSQSNLSIDINRTTILNKEPRFSKLIYKTLYGGAKVEFLDVIYNNDTEYFKVKYSYSTGYIKSSSVKITNATLQNIITKKRYEFLSKKMESLPDEIKEINKSFLFYGKAHTNATPLKVKPSDSEFYQVLIQNTSVRILGEYSWHKANENLMVEYNGIIGWINAKDIELDLNSQLFLDYVKEFRNISNRYDKENLSINKKEYFNLGNSFEIDEKNVKKDESFFMMLKKIRKDELIEKLKILGTFQEKNDSLNLILKQEIKKQTSYLSKKKKLVVEENLIQNYNNLISEEERAVENNLQIIDAEFNNRFSIILNEQKIFQDSINMVLAERKEQDKLIASQRLKAQQLQKEEEEARNKIEAERAIAQRLTYLEKRFGKDNATRIFNKKAWIGMTESMLVESWGKPRSINKTTTEYGTRKQYVYSSGNIVYIGYDGLVETIQN